MPRRSGRTGLLVRASVASFESPLGVEIHRALVRQVMDDLLRELEQSDFQSAPAMDRIESMISTRPELERYTAILAAKMQGDDARSREALNRLERLSKAYVEAVDDGSGIQWLL